MIVVGTSEMAVGTIVGEGRYRYAIDAAWGRRDGSGVRKLGLAQGVSGDSQDRVFVFQRAPVACVLVFDRDGKLLDRWGDGRFASPHGIWTNARDELLLTDTETHTVTKWTPSGELLRVWGNEHIAGSWSEPFNRPTKAVEAANGEMYVADGYGNRHVHRYDAHGDLVRSWGAEGEGPSEFVLPHDVVVDERDRVLVCDRENRRVQRFDRDGNYLGEWAHWQNPMQIYARDGVMYVAHRGGEISIRTLDGELLAGWRYESLAEDAPERTPHSIWVDSSGDIYVGEVLGENGLQKFICQ
jgi:sugar lactone lactonase YvrE